MLESDPEDKSLSSPEHTASLNSLSYKNNKQTGVREFTESRLEKENVLSNYTEEEVMAMGRAYARKYGLEDEDLFARAAAVARQPGRFVSMQILSDDEKTSLQEEIDHPFWITKDLLKLVVMASMGAAVQGMDETVINGANLFFPTVFGIGDDSDRSSWLLGLVNCSPYLCCSTISCWCTDWLNNEFGRRGTIFICCVVSAVTCIWSAFTNTWYHLFIARFFLGFGIGPKSTTTPVYTSECAPTVVRGGLIMFWQMFTAFGVMLGYVSSLLFYKVPNHGTNSGLGWRITLGSACLPAIIILFQIPFCPESPRWLMGKERHQEAFASYLRIRRNRITAARDCFYTYVLLKEESAYNVPFFQKVKELFSVRRNRNGAIGAWIVMFMQQFCGVNVITFYSSSIFSESGFSTRDALLGSWGFGMLAWISAIPTVFTIDKFGRRNILLVAFPLMAVFLLMVGFSFWIPKSNKDGRVTVISLGIYLFVIVYGYSEGPIPFTYSAEAAALYVRDVTMSFATATTWFFNFILSLTWPSLLKKFKPQGAFGWYAAWNIVGFFMVLWFLPETKGLTLEELDDVFDVPAGKHASYQTHKLINAFERVVLRQNVPPIEPLYKHHRTIITNKEWDQV